MAEEDLTYFWGNHIKVHVHDQDLDFLKANDEPFIF
jgi:hypothetical protein